jgi:hypothetical protein
VLPVLVADGVSVNLLPPELSSIQHVDYRRQDKRAAIDVLKALSGLPKSPPLPDPLPEPPSPPLSYLGGLMEQIEATVELTFKEQAALVLKLKEGLGGVEHREEVRTLLTRLKQRDDLYARIGPEIDALLAPNARVQPNSRPSATSEKPSSSTAAHAEATTLHKLWLIASSLLGFVAAIVTPSPMRDFEVLWVVLWPIYGVVICFFPRFAGQLWDRIVIILRKHG